MRKMRKGYLWIGIGVAMIVFDLTVKPIFSIKLTSSFQFPIAVLALLYGVLSLIGARMAASQASLSSEELRKWGDHLEAITPEIITLSEEGNTSEEIVSTLEKTTPIPADILIKYLYGLKQYLDGQSKDARIDERRKMDP